MLQLGYVLFWVVRWITQFAVAFPKTFAILMIFSVISLVAERHEGSRAVLSGMGLSKANDVLFHPVGVNWGTAHDCGVMQCDPHRYLTLEITNPSPTFYREFHFDCSTPTSGIADDLMLYDTTGVAAHVQREVRSYQVDDSVSSVTDCRLSTASIGKPSDASLGQPYTGSNRTAEVMLPEDKE